MYEENGVRTILVTGARGYIGGRLCLAIARCPDFALIGASRYSTRPKSFPEKGRFIRLDPGEGIPVRSQNLAGVDTIIHLAAADQTSSEKDPQGALETTTRATVDLLEAASAAQVRRFIYVSTAHVYGTPLIGRIDENSLPRPTHPYAITHRAAEDFVLAAHRTGRLQGVVLRLSNGIGAAAHADGSGSWTTIGNDLCRQAATTRILRLNSSGEQWRDFITLGDVTAALIHMIDTPSNSLGDGLFNLGGAMPLRILDVAEKVAARAALIFGQRPNIVRPPGPPAQPIDYRIDKLLTTGFRPVGGLENELDATLEMYRTHFAAGYLDEAEPQSADRVNSFEPR
jgi:UDP-glucose 4-epimerase